MIIEDVCCDCKYYGNPKEWTKHKDKITVDAKDLFCILFDLKDIEMYEFSVDPEEDHELLVDAIARLEKYLEGYESIFKRSE